MSGPERQYWDSALFINLITAKNPDNVAAIEHLWNRALNGNAEIYLSYLVLSEVRPKPEFADEYAVVNKEFLEADWPFMHWMAVTRDVANDARLLTKDYPRLCNPDAIHVASALKANTAVFFTFDGLGEDKKLRRTKGLLAMSPVRGLRIEAPTPDYGNPDAPLFTAMGVTPPPLVAQASKSTAAARYR